MKLPTMIFAASIAALPALASAATKSYGVSAGIGTSDNIGRTSTNEQSETIASAGFDFSLQEDTPRLRANAAANLSYFEYLDDTYDGEVVGDLTALAVASLLPERIEWLFQENFGQVARDPFQPVTPLNRENINYFTTGPDFTLRLGSATRGKLSGRYSKVSYEDSPLDNDRLGMSLALLRNLSASTFVSANLQTEKTSYDDAALTGSDYDHQDGFLGYTAEGSRTRLNAELGYSILSRDDGGRDSKGLLARIDATRQLSHASKLTLRIGHEFSDAGSSFRLQQGIGIPDTQSVLQTAAPFVNKYVSLGWDVSGQRTGFGLSGALFDEGYEQQNILDRRRTQLGAYIYRMLAPHLRFELRGDTARDDYRYSDGDFRDNGGSAALSWQATGKMALSLRYEYAQRDASVASTSEYREKRAWLQVTYGSPKASVPAKPQL